MCQALPRWQQNLANFLFLRTRVDQISEYFAEKTAEEMSLPLPDMLQLRCYVKVKHFLLCGFERVVHDIRLTLSQKPSIFRTDL